MCFGHSTSPICSYPFRNEVTSNDKIVLCDTSISGENREKPAEKHIVEFDALTSFPLKQEVGPSSLKNEHLPHRLECDDVQDDS